MGGIIMKAVLLALSCATVSLGSVAAAQTAPTAVPAPAVSATLRPASGENVLRSGTPVPLKMAEMLTTKGKKLKVGQRFNMEVAQAVEVNGVVVIPAGSPAIGEVTEVRNKGMWGKSGAINARVLYARVNGRQIRLSGSLDDKGVTGTAGVVGALVVVPIAGFLMTGTSAVIPLGAPVNGFVDEDVPFVRGEAAAPLTVAVSASPAK